MKKISTISAILFLLTCILPAKEKLLPAHRDWLDLVSPIITKIEKEVFDQLSSGREREKFIRLFWKRRDPLPDTEKNEFLEEYQGRVRFADRTFGRGAVKKGSKTERGYFYLLLGPPLDRQIYATQSQLWPLELWHYKGDPRFGLPPFYYLLFLQQDGLGEYKLYSPGVDSPEKLVIAGMVQTGLNRSTAYQTIKDISGELASASLSYLPGDSTGGGGSLSSLNIIANIHGLAEKKFSDAYARNFLYYKDFVETEYTHNYLDCHFLIKVFRSAGQDFIHWSIEPDKVNLSYYDGKYYAALQLILRIEDTKGNVVMEREENIPVSISPDDQNKFERRPMAFQDIMPIIPGDYTLFFLLQNKTSREFASFHTRLSVPSSSSELRLGPFLLYQSREARKNNQKNKLKAFTFGEYQYIFDNRNNIRPEKGLGVFGRIDNLQDKAPSVLQIDFIDLDTAKSVHSITKKMDEILLADRSGFDTGTLDICIRSAPGQRTGEFYPNRTIRRPSPPCLLQTACAFPQCGRPVHTGLPVLQNSGFFTRTGIHKKSASDERFFSGEGAFGQDPVCPGTERGVPQDRTLCLRKDPGPRSRKDHRRQLRSSEGLEKRTGLSPEVDGGRPGDPCS